MEILVFQHVTIAFQPPMTDPNLYPSYLNPLLNPSLNSSLNSLNPTLSWPPSMLIPPGSIYGITPRPPGDNLLHPPLHSLPQGCSSGTSSMDLSHPLSSNLGVEKPFNSGKGRKHEEFTTADLNNLLCVTIEVNPFSAPWNSIRGACKEVTEKTQGCDADTCKNRVTLLLAWCEVRIAFSFFHG